MNKDEKDSTKDLIASLGLPEDFLERLLLESDWSFVIKIHALFEAVLAGLVIKKLGNPALSEPVSNLEFSHAKAGKVTFAKALELLDSNEATFLRGLSELRNDLVHNVYNVNFNLQNYLKGLDSNQRKRFRSKFGYSVLRLNDGEAEYERLVNDHPMLIIYLAAYSCLFALQFNMSNYRIDMLIEALRKQSVK